jgi:heme oxygenase
VERLGELREIQSVYLKKRDEEEAAVWRDFQERYDAAMVQRNDCEAVLKVREEEMPRLQGGDEGC